MPKFSCKGCKDRVPGCHGYCEKYKREAAEWEKMKEYLRQEDDILDYKRESHNRYNRRRGRGKWGY